MNALNQIVRTPLVSEQSVHNKAIVGGGVTTTVLSTVASINAVYIDVFVQPTVDLKHVYLILYAANGKIAWSQQIHGAITANTQQGARWGGSLGTGMAIGQYYDVTVTTANAALDGTIEAWTAARS